MTQSSVRSAKVRNTGFARCGGCGETYDYAPDSPPHVCEDAPLGRDHWLVSGRIDGIREALGVMRSGISRNEVERQLEERIAVLMKTG